MKKKNISFIENESQFTIMVQCDFNITKLQHRKNSNKLKIEIQSRLLLLYDHRGIMCTIFRNYYQKGK